MLLFAMAYLLILGIEIMITDNVLECFMQQIPCMGFPTHLTITLEGRYYYFSIAEMQKQGAEKLNTMSNMT